MAVVWANGRIDITRWQPKGSILLARGPRGKLEAAIGGTARLAYDNCTWLVPGVPEAEDDIAAIEAVKAYQPRLRQALDARMARGRDLLDIHGQEAAAPKGRS
jgi:hypothetical protein